MVFDCAAGDNPRAESGRHRGRRDRERTTPTQRERRFFPQITITKKGRSPFGRDREGHKARHYKGRVAVSLDEIVMDGWVVAVGQASKIFIVFHC